MKLTEGARRITSFLKKEPQELTLREKLSENDVPFPWGLIDMEERDGILQRQKVISDVRFSKALVSPWCAISDARAKELAREATRIITTTEKPAATVFSPKTHIGSSKPKFRFQR